MIRRLLPAGRGPHVCIVGAGMTGLRCAEVLIKNGIRVTILEGRDRIGGRIHQTRAGDRLVDVGPNWIHGTVNNPILEIAREVKAALHSWEERQAVVDEHGALLDPAQAKECAERMWGIIAAAFQHSDENVDSISPEQSLADFFRTSIDRLFSDSTDDESEQDGVPAMDDRNKQQLLWMAEFWGAIIGDPIERQSLKFFWLEEGIEGENLFVASTYKDILGKVAALPLEKASMRFSKKVVSIKAPDTTKEESQVTITTADGETQQYDEVVVTVPLGWLKRNKEAFSPPLPPRLAQAIDAISYGNLEKFYISFPRAFWHENHEANAGNGRALKPNAEEDDAAQGAPSFIHWIHPLYAPEKNPHCWIQEAVNLSALEAPHDHPTLLFYTFGPCSKHLTSLVSSSPSSSHKDVLTEFFEPYYSRLPGYSPTSPDCKPTAILGTSWSTDEMAGYGSYSNFQVGLTAADVDIEVMRAGMPERRIWLAGEHTAPFVASGTVTGAYWSGEAVAERIIHEAYGQKRVDPRTYEFITGKGEPRGMDQ